MQRARKLSLLIVIYLAIIVVLLEIIFRLIGPGLPGAMGVAARWVTTGQPYSADWTPAWQQSDQHYYALRPGIDSQRQYGSPTVQFTLSTVELWDGAGIGFRTDPVDYFVDAVVVGDSFGMCFTERADCWVDHLAALRGSGIVNLSQPVTGTTSHLRILETFGAPMTPPLVIWQAFGNDFNDDYGLAVFRDEIEPVDDADAEPADAGGIGDWLLRNSALVAVTHAALNGTYTAVPAGERIHAKPYSVSFGDENEHIMQFGSQYEQQAMDMSREANQIGLARSREAFEQAQTLIAEWEGELAVVIIPTREEVYAHLTAPIMGQAAIDRLTSAREALNNLCDELSLRCYDVTEDFRARALADEALYHVDDMHLNPHGNAVLASLLDAWLRDTNLLTCNGSACGD